MKEADLLQICYFLLARDNERLTSFLVAMLDDQENSFNTPEQLVAVLSVSPTFVTFLNITAADVELVDDHEAFQSIAGSGDHKSEEFRAHVVGIDGCYAIGAAYRRCVMTRDMFGSLAQAYEDMQATRG